jgi:hypothetical protein
MVIKCPHCMTVIEVVSSQPDEVCPACGSNFTSDDAPVYATLDHEAATLLPTSAVENHQGTIAAIREQLPWDPQRSTHHPQPGTKIRYFGDYDCSKRLPVAAWVSFTRRGRSA